MTPMVDASALGPVGQTTARKLEVDYLSDRTLARIVGGLRSIRLDAGLSQNALAAGLPVRGRAISEWETRAIEPALDHLIQWSRELGQRLAIVDRRGELRTVRQRPDESWETFTRRRLAWPLKSRRQFRGWSQDKLGLLVGVTQDSIQRWELARVPPRPISLVVWAQKLDCAVVLRPIDPATGDFKRTGPAA